MYCQMNIKILKIGIFFIVKFGFVDGSEHSESDRDQAKALLMAGKHLPENMLPCNEDRIALISEASKMYESLGDKKSLQNCRQMIMQFEDKVSAQTVLC